jgi:hypothetical protein
MRRQGLGRVRPRHDLTGCEALATAAQFRHFVFSPIRILNGGPAEHEKLTYPLGRHVGFLWINK